MWEEADGLDPEDFDPKTFFNLHGRTSTNQHLLKMLLVLLYRINCKIIPFFNFFFNADTNGDGFFDEQELEALFTKEVKS